MGKVMITSKVEKAIKSAVGMYGEISDSKFFDYYMHRTGSGVFISELEVIKKLNPDNPNNYSAYLLLYQAFAEGYEVSEMPEKFITADEAFYEAMFNRKIINCWDVEGNKPLLVNSITYVHGTGFAYLGTIHGHEAYIPQTMEYMKVLAITGTDYWYTVGEQPEDDDE